MNFTPAVNAAYIYYIILYYIGIYEYIIFIYVV